MSEGLRENSSLPRDIAVGLAKDVDEVAVPMLRTSPVLSEADLVGIVASQPLQQQLAVAERDDLGETVSEALAETGEREIVKTLAANPSARMSAETYGNIISAYSGDEEVLAKIIQRPELPATVVELLDDIVSGDLRAKLDKHRRRPKINCDDLDPEMSDDDLLNFVDLDADRDDVEELVEEFIRMGRLTPPLIVQSLCLGDFRFFEMAMSQLSGIPIDNIRMLLYDLGNLGLESLRRAADMSLPLIKVVRMVLSLTGKSKYDGNPSNPEQFQKRVIALLDKKFDGQASQNLGRLLSRLAA